MSDDIRKRVTEARVEEQAAELLRSVRRIRKGKGLTQTDVADAVDRHQKTVSRYENPSDLGTELRSVVRLAEGCGIRLYPIDLDDVLRGAA
mgnify:FL=1